jgi:acetyl-CoA synthetase
MSNPIIAKRGLVDDGRRLPTGWDAARGRLDGLPGGGLNIAHEAVDRHVAAGHGAETAIIWLGREGERRVLTYAELAAEAARFAHVLRARGIAPGDRMFLLSGRVPELYAATLGAMKAGVVVSPLFAAFGPEPVRARMEIGDARVLVTTAQQYARKVAPWRAEMPGLELVLIIGDEAPEGCVPLGPAMAGARGPSRPNLPARGHGAPALHLGDDGSPQGRGPCARGRRRPFRDGRLALDLRPGDIYWCTADPGWVTGMSYGIISPLCNRATMVVDEAEFDLDRWYGILERERIAVWYTAPTAIRMMMRAGAEAAAGHDFSALRFLASVGEPLNAECVLWGEKVFGLPFHDNWWQTETGGIMIANTADMDIKPGAMGKPLPGIAAGIVARDGDTVRELPDGEIGELALRPGWPSMMRGYLGQPERYAKAFAGGWYLTGDLAMRDADGYFWFVGRADDLIKSSGHLIGPFEVESALIEHPAVAEAAVIGVPDETAGEVVKAFVTLKAGFAPDEALERELRGHARKRLGPAVAPREIVFRESLPRTRSGKIMRRLLGRANSACRKATSPRSREMRDECEGEARPCPCARPPAGA